MDGSRLVYSSRSLTLITMHRSFFVNGFQENKLATTVKHVAIEVSSRHRADMLEDIITVYGKGSHAIVFTQTKRECDELAAGKTFQTLTSNVGEPLFAVVLVLFQCPQERRVVCI